MKRCAVLLVLMVVSLPALAQVDVEAVVTDLEGNRVRGLSAGDFRLLVDGAEVPVERFAEVAGGAVGRSYLVFVDDSLSIAVQRDLVLWEIERDLDRLGPDDRMAIVAFDGARLHPLADWTGNRETLAAALAEARKRPAKESLTRSTMWVANTVAGTAAGALRSVSPSPGRKVMLVLSGGWPSGPSLQLVRDANRLGYTLYPVDVPAFERERAPHAAEDTLLALAEATGGQAALNSNRLAALERAEEDTRSYYLLGFSQAWKADDRDHRIELEVRRPGLDVRARHGFPDVSPATLAGMETEDLLLSAESRETAE
ncbi:MAG TPA: VWA domain-containing protein [Thermoanaerobaculia bacterium]|jgi:VWFA-related protein|nr:VWA domain-containing protein [Thermoanaerobaculia bacterium]